MSNGNEIHKVAIYKNMKSDKQLLLGAPSSYCCCFELSIFRMINLWPKPWLFPFLVHMHSNIKILKISGNRIQIVF